MLFDFNRRNLSPVLEASRDDRWHGFKEEHPVGDCPAKYFCVRAKADSSLSYEIHHNSTSSVVRTISFCVLLVEGEN